MGLGVHALSLSALERVMGRKKKPEFVVIVLTVFLSAFKIAGSSLMHFH